MFNDLMPALRDFVAGLPEGLQGLGVFLVSLVPFVEGEGAGLIGVVVGVSPWLAVPAAVLGNVLAVALLVYTAHGVRTAVTSRRSADARTATGAPDGGRTAAGAPDVEHRARLRRRFEAWGVPGLSLLGPWFFIPGHLAAPAMVSFGAARGRVMLWQVVAIVLYTVVSVLISVYLMHALGLQAAADTLGL